MAGDHLIGRTDNRFARKKQAPTKYFAAYVTRYRTITRVPFIGWGVGVGGGVLLCGLRQFSGWGVGGWGIMHFVKFFDHPRPLHRKFFENVDVCFGG